MNDLNTALFARMNGDTGTAATAQIDFTLKPNDGETLTVGGKTYTFVSVLTGAPDEISTGGGSTGTMAAIRTRIAVNADTLATLSTAAGGTILTLTANAAGTSGNSIALSTTSAGLVLTPFSGGVAGLGTLSTGGVHYGRAPQTQSPPYTIFQKQAGTQSYTFGRRAFDNMLYLAKGVASDSATEGGRKIAGAIAERLDEILTDYALSVSGKTLLNLRKESDVDYVETDPDTKQAIYHVGCLFRIEVTG